MGFLQRGFAWGNKRGFAAKMLSPELLIRLFTFTAELLEGGGKAEKTEQILTFDKVIGLGSYPDSLALFFGVDLTTFQQASSGGGGKSTEVETVFTATVELSLGSYP
ncbi:hypothetical protein ES708_04947 [subsurface metagenome]